LYTTPDQYYAYFEYYYISSLTDDLIKNILFTLLENEYAMSSQGLINKMIETERLDNKKQKLVFEKLKYLYPENFRFDKHTSLLEIKGLLNSTINAHLNPFLQKQNKILNLNWNREDSNTNDHLCSVTYPSKEYCKMNKDILCYHTSKYLISLNFKGRELTIIGKEEFEFIQITWSGDFEDNCSMASLSLYNIPKGVEPDNLPYLFQYVKHISGELKKFEEERRKEQLNQISEETKDSEEEKLRQILKLKLEQILAEKGEYNIREFMEILRALEPIKTQKLVCRRSFNDKLYFHLEKKNIKYKTKFLDVLLKPNIRTETPQVKLFLENLAGQDRSLSFLRKNQIYKYSDILNDPHLIDLATKIINDSRNWTYKINLKGFFLYLFLETKNIHYINRNLQKGGTKSEKLIHRDNRKMKLNKNSRQINRIKKRIEKIISTQTIHDMCPFLLFQEDFKDIGLDSVEILLNIAGEVIAQMDYYDHGAANIFASDLSQDNYLLWKICERYYYEVEKFFSLQKIDNPQMFMFLFKLNKKIRMRSFKKIESDLNNKESILNLEYQDITYYRNIYEKVCIYRMNICKILSNAMKFEKDRLINIYSRAYENYGERNFPNPPKFASPDDFKDLFL
jgi:hypothetical protein